MELVEKVKKAAIDLERDGYAVIEELFSKEECEQLYARMWQHWSNLSGGQMKPELDYSKWKATDLPAHKHGIIESWRLNHLDVIREIRRDARILQCFALLYGTDQLTASMDRINFKFPGRAYHSKGTWPHADQHPGRLGRISIQSYLTLLDCHEDSPGNRFYQGSHAIFEQFFEAKREKMKSGDWNTLTDEERIALPKLCPLVKPTYKAGSLVLWDSRTVHDPDDGTCFKEGRFVVYLCYNRLWEAAKDERFALKKQKAFQTCRATNHSPVPMSLFAKTPRTYGREKGKFDEIPLDQLGLDQPTEPIGVEKYLFCFKPYKNREGCLLGDPHWQQHCGQEEPLLDFVSPFTPLVTSKAVKRKSNK